MVVEVIVPILAVLFAGSAWIATRQAALISSLMMFRNTNDLVFDKISVLGPLTPYDHSPGGLYETEEGCLIRRLLLLRFSRFRHANTIWEMDTHIAFRLATMGKSVSEFGEQIVSRGGTAEFADLACRILLDIREREPYYQSSPGFGGGMWDRFFADYKWSYPVKSKADPADARSSHPAIPNLTHTP